MNILQSGNNELVYVDYSDLLDKILQVLRNPQHENIFKISTCKQRLLININHVANQVAILAINSPLGASSNSAKTATVNFSPGFAEQFPVQIREIKDCLEDLLAFQVEQHSLSIQQFIEDLTTDLQRFKGNSSSLDFSYAFGSYNNLQKQRLTVLGKNEKGKELLRFHKLTISVQKTKEFDEQLRAGLEKYIKAEFGDKSEAEREDLSYILDDLYQDKDKLESDFYKLKQIIDRETLGKLKKQAQINYLEFLHENLNVDTGSNNAQAVVYLQDTIRRLRLVDEYINNINKADGDYLVSYAGVSLNYRDIFSRGEAFDSLPIIPKVEGYLGETKDEEKGEIQFIFGLKLKFDGKVQAYGGRNVFEYYLNLLNPDSKEHQDELNDELQQKSFASKILRIVFLYYLMFAYRPNSSTDVSNQNPELEYNPIPVFDQKVIPILKGDDDEAKRNLFRGMLKGFEKYDIQNKITILKQSLTNLIKSKRNFPTREYPLHLSVGKSILEKDIEEIFNQNTFFKSVLRGNPKQLLKYISIGEASTKINTLCSLPAKITINDIHYASSDECQSFNMEYDITNIRALPVLFLPFQDKKCQDVYNQSLKHRKLILFPYRLEDNQLDSQQLFIYNFSFSLLVYISLKVFLPEKPKLFIPILRLHLHNKEDNTTIEKFIVSLSKVLSHLLNEEHRSNSQGIDIRNLKYKLPNVFSSLYSVLPKKFTFNHGLESPQEVNNLVIIIVSSRESDRSWKGSQKISNVMGEILGFTCQNGVIKIKLIKTFSDNYQQQQLFTHPTVVIDEVAKLYQQGYKRFIYIAKAPYTSSLYMTQKDEDDGLFFMSREVIRAFKAKHDNIKIYPMFFDKYYASKFPGKIGVNSLYIQDTVELSSLVDDPSKKSVVFFNLFNGVTIGKGAERNYNGVISYATFANIYKGILDDEDIYKGLIFNGTLKNEILQLLTLFHFSRYEKAQDINVKLNPYENLIGDESVGTLCLFNHMRGKSFFNSLAFLTEVKKILNVRESDLR
ncbi:hypothetical protein IQ247_07055 [Plectonema cf. radiosum LEGE 06105]|uniref:Uncharacterized protein n=1 Tax=Plectonema cf. radiosum LEGE 06105 TaxID=945769 RepID=A0A8J7K1Y8_9CYAN|nr:hypothetical protein [Plectonema radiosum]MBE9212472.1 hypothetical protein [Plectonema cf. radiosum LEGE 06105]